MITENQIRKEESESLVKSTIKILTKKYSNVLDIGDYSTVKQQGPTYSTGFGIWIKTYPNDSPDLEKRKQYAQYRVDIKVSEVLEVHIIGSKQTFDIRDSRDIGSSRTIDNVSKYIINQLEKQKPFTPK